jgi:hypothetical protein
MLVVADHLTLQIPLSGSTLAIYVKLINTLHMLKVTLILIALF